MKISLVITLITVALLSSCTAAKVSVPDRFQSAATPMKVKGVNGFTINQKLSFANFQTSKIRRGWDFNGTLQYTRFSFKPEDMVLSVFNIGSDRKHFNQRNKFQYTISDGNLAAEIFAQERFDAKELVYRSRNPIIDGVTRTDSYTYSFGAAIIPLTADESKPWSLVMTNHYDRKADTARGLFDRPYVETTGYATNEEETIEIRTLMIRDVATKSGKRTKIIGGPMLSGYELRIDDAVIAVVDILDNTVWMYNELEAKDKLIVSAVASAIFLKRIQDAERDRADEL